MKDGTPRPRVCWIAVAVLTGLLLGAVAVPAGATPARASAHSAQRGASAPGSAARTKWRARNHRIVLQARRHVGQPYVFGAAGPRSFDCSGLVVYVFRVAAHIRLPHSSEAQFARAHKIPRRRARPGDLVFYFSGRDAYHVAIYTGHDRTIVAATPGEGVIRQTIYSSDVRFGSFTH